MKKIFVAVGSTASDAVIDLAKRCRDENLDKDGMLARDFKYITMDTDLRVKDRLEKLYKDRTRVHGIRITHEAEGSAVLESILAVREAWKGRLKIDPFGAYGIRRKTAGTRTWVSKLKQCFVDWNINLETEELEILVVGTACGATCTGMYWDVAGCLRAWSNQAITVCGVVCLPDLAKAPIRTPEGIYPIPRNFCAFMQDMRQIALLNSLRNRRNGVGGHYFKPVTFKEIQADTGSHRGEDCFLPLLDTRDARLDTSRLPVDAMFFLPPRVDDAKQNFADQLFVHAAIYHYSGAGGQADMGNAAHRGGVFGGLYLSVATSPLFDAVKKAVQERWQDVRTSFLSSQDVMDEKDKEIIANLIRPQTDSLPMRLTEAIRTPKEWFEDWVDSRLTGKPPKHRLEEVVARLSDSVKAGLDTYMDEKPFPLSFLGTGNSNGENAGDTFIDIIRKDAEAWGCVYRDSGIRIGLPGLEKVYLEVCDEIKKLGGATNQDREAKSTAMLRAMIVAGETFAKVAVKRGGKVAVNVFGQRQAVVAEAAKNFKAYAEQWFDRLGIIFLMQLLASQLPGKDRLDREIENYSRLMTGASHEVVEAQSYSDLQQRIRVTREDVLTKLFEGMNLYDETKNDDVNAQTYQDLYEAFVSEHVAEMLAKLSRDPSFDKAPFMPRFPSTIQGFSSDFKRNEEDKDKDQGALVKHICKHAGDIQKPTYGAVGEFSPSFRTLKPEAVTNDSFDPFAEDGQQIPHRITEAPVHRRLDCYFGQLQEVPSTFLRMWIGVLALDKSLPELMEQIYPLNTRMSIEDNSMSSETKGESGDFVRLINLREAVELGVMLGYLTKKMKAQTGRIGGVHLKRKDSGQELLTWGQERVSSFWENADLKRIDIRTIRDLLAWLREVNTTEEARKHVQFWNEKDWMPLTDETFMFDTQSNYLTALDDLEQYLGAQVEVSFDPYLVG